MPSNVGSLSTPRIFLRKTANTTTSSVTLKRMTWESSTTSNIITPLDITYSTGTGQTGTAGHIIINTSGMYFISGFVIFETGSDANYRRVQLALCDSSDTTLDSSGFLEDQFIGTAIASATYSTYVPFSATRYLSSGDRVKLLFAHNSPTSINILSGTGIQLALISAG